MIPYGKNRKLRENFPDNHPKKGYVNWWEVELGSVDKGRARQEAKIEIRKELDEIEIDHQMDIDDILIEELDYPCYFDD